MSKTGYEVLVGDCIESMKGMKSESIDCVVTSPPYWGLRDYGTAEWEGGDPDCEHTISMNTKWGDSKKRERLRPEVGHRGGDSSACHLCGAKRIDSQLGLEDTPDEYVENMVKVFREVKRILKPTGTAWLNLGDTYAGGGGASGHTEETMNAGRKTASYGATSTRGRVAEGLKAKDLVGIPWRVALALQADGWWLRQDIIWQKPSCLPEPVKDRCTKNHEYIFLLTKRKYYYFDYLAIREPNADPKRKNFQPGNRSFGINSDRNDNDIGKRIKEADYVANGRNKRSVWSVTPASFKGAHFAVFPPNLIEPCVLAGSSAFGCCADCGAPWERVTERQGTTQDSDLVQKTEGLLNPKRGGHRTTKTGSFPSYETGETNHVGWQPTCECHGKFEKKDAIIPARMSKKEVADSTWGSSLTGEYHGEATKDFDSVKVQNASDVKKRIIKNATTDRIRKIKVYTSDLSIEKHPVVPSVVFDPFGGSGTTAGVAIKNGRKAILCELNEDYIEIMDDRIASIAKGWRKGQLTLGDF